MDKNVIRSYYKVHYIEFARISTILRYPVCCYVVLGDAVL